MEPVLTSFVREPNSFTLDVSLKHGAYEGLKKALSMSQAQVIETVKASGLRGRGGAGFPTGMKWSFVPKDSPKPKYVCCNADESEPGTFKDHVLKERNPHLVLEGVAIACYAIGAKVGYIYIRGEFFHVSAALEAAVAEAKAAGYLGRNLFGSGFDCEIHVHRGAGAYEAGEESALLESLEGKRAQPRLRPPFPAVVGLYGSPTIINNVETLANVPSILTRGPEWYASLGPEKNGGPKLYCISGHVNRPCCVELPLGVTARELIDEHAGGVWKGRKAKAVVPGGISMGFLSADELDTPLDFAGPLKAGCLGLGTAAVVVVDDQTSMVDVLYNCCRFMSHESCGQCTPCREGTAWMTKILTRVRSGAGKLEDLDLLYEVAASMGIIPGTTICGLSDGAAWPVKNAIKKFRGEFEDYITSGRRSITPADELMAVH